MRSTKQTLLIVSMSLASTALASHAHADSISLGDHFKLEVKDASLFNNAAENIGETGNFLVSGEVMGWRPDQSKATGEYCEIRTSKRFFTGDTVRMEITETDDRISSSKPGTFDHRFTASSFDGSVNLECQILQNANKNFMPIADVDNSLGKAASVTVLLNQ
jgi:hypothetical protein